MASKRNALTSLIPGLDPDFCIGFHFLPTYEEGITIVNIKNEGGKLPPIFNVYRGGLFQRQPEQLEEGYYFTRLETRGEKVNRTLQDGSGHWKNILTKTVKDGNKSIGWVTKLVLLRNKNTPTEWHILEYRDRKTPDARRWVLCQIYKRGKNNDSGSLNQDQIPHLAGEHMNQDQIPVVGHNGYPPPGDVVNNPQQFPSCTDSNGGVDTVSVIDPYTIVRDPMASDIVAGQFYPTTSQYSSIFANGPRGDMSYPGEHMNQDQIPGVDQYWYPPPGDVVNNPQQFTSNNTSSIGGIHMDSWNESIGGIDMDSWNESIGGIDIDPNSIGGIDMDFWNESINQRWP